MNQAGDGGSSEPAVGVELCEVDSEYILKVDEGRVFVVVFQFFVLGGIDGNQKFGFKHVGFKISFRHPGELVKNRQLDVRAWNCGNVRADSGEVGVISVQWH